MQRLTSSTEGVAGRGRKDLSGKILKRHYFFVVLDYCFEIQSSLLVTAASGLRKRLRAEPNAVTQEHQHFRSPATLTRLGCARAPDRGDQNCPVLLNGSERGWRGANTLGGLKLPVILLGFTTEKQ